MNRLSPAVMQAVGVVLLLSSAVFWAVSGRQNVELVSASLTLITLGSMWEGQERIGRETKGYELPGDTDEKDEDDEDEPPPKPRRGRGKPERVPR